MLGSALLFSDHSYWLSSLEATDQTEFVFLLQWKKKRMRRLKRKRRRQRSK